MANLKAIIGEELFKQLPDEKQKEYEKKDLEDISDGAFIPKVRFDQVNEQAKEYKKQVGERDNQISTLKEEYKDVSGLKDKVTKLEDDNKKQKEDYESKLQEINFSNALDKALGEYKVKNSKLVKALLENEKLKVDGDSIIGLKEQMEAIKKENEFLFEKEVPGAPDFLSGGDSTKLDNKSLGEKLGEAKASSLKTNQDIDKFFS
ncbi:MAG: phage scaffolding protein [Clostridium sp.]|uniref:phage scaffolding protein n=1 Tax=Clostridium sp. TaxID=1506 RepID=UPI00290826D8|nr:phage scaffolding protein [Clostridium sp.]MDU7948702.1 phage scaffolding protein [Clostridium sp.]